MKQFKVHIINVLKFQHLCISLAWFNGVNTGTLILFSGCKYIYRVSCSLTTRKQLQTLTQDILGVQTGKTNIKKANLCILLWTTLP